MYNFKQYHQLLSFFKKEERCMKFIKHFKFKNNNLKSMIYIDKGINKTLNLSNKI